MKDVIRLIETWENDVKYKKESIERHFKNNEFGKAKRIEIEMNELLRCIEELKRVVG